MKAAGPRGFPFRPAMNCSTLRPFRLDIFAQLRLCREAGYEGIEPWMRELTAFAEAGGSLSDVRKRAEDLGIEIFDAIGLIKWADRDPEVRRRAMEEARREMEMLQEIGCPAVGAPPAGDTEGVSTEQYAERFRELWRLGEQFGVEPLLEIWGHRGGIRTVRKACDILDACGLPKARVLVDPIHIYKGGGSFSDIGELAEGSIGVAHVNDFTVALSPEQLPEKDRRLPGDGDADLASYARELLMKGYRGFLSLELFIEDYGRRDAAEVLQDGLERMRRICRR